MKNIGGNRQGIGWENIIRACNRMVRNLLSVLGQQGMLGGCSKRRDGTTANLKKSSVGGENVEKQGCGESHLLGGGWARPYKGLNQDDGLQRKWKEGIQRKELKTSLKFHKAKHPLSDFSRKIPISI